MKPSEIMREVKNHPERVLERDGVGTGYICPLCGSGSGVHGTGMQTKDGEHYTCFACRGIQNNDLLDIIGKIERTDGSFMENIKAACHIYGIYDGDIQPDKDDGTRATSAVLKPKEPEAPKEDYTDFLLESQKHLRETDYLLKRGISYETAERHNVGYCEKWIHPKLQAEGKTAYPSPRLIIPSSSEGYLARDTRPDLTDTQKKYAKQKAGKTALFNTKALYKGGCIFVVEGEIDAMSIEESGGNAIALCSTSNADMLIRQLYSLKKQNLLPEDLHIIVGLDTDKAGQKAARQIENGLNALKIPSYTAVELYGEYKDANEMLQKEPETLKKNIQVAIETAKAQPIIEGQQEPETPEPPKEPTIKEAQEPKRKEERHAINAAGLLPYWIEDSNDESMNKAIPTRFENLDGILDGGLYPGLYVIGAVSAAGKTTFLLQVADQIAEQGHDVLIFSLEMAAGELIAKSISRNTAIAAQREPSYTMKNALSVRNVSRPQYTENGKSIKETAIDYYRQYAERLYICEGVGDITVEKIKQEVQRHIQNTGNTPVVIVDYLQIIAPLEVRASDKQNTDKAVIELKRLSRDYETPVITVSSFNRMNYTQAVNMTAFKESGAIEYSSDVLLGLQYEGMDGTEGVNDNDARKLAREIRTQADDNAKRGLPVNIQIKVLKNRNGSAGTSAYFKYYKMFQYFKSKDKEK